MKAREMISAMIKTENKAIEWKARNGLNILRISLGLIFR